MRGYKNITKAIDEIPSIEDFINIITERSTELEKDLDALEYILEYHTSEQLKGFLPRFISLL